MFTGTDRVMPLKLKTEIDIFISTHSTYLLLNFNVVYTTNLHKKRCKYKKN